MFNAIRLVCCTFVQDKGRRDFCRSSIQTNDNHFASLGVNSRLSCVKAGLPLMHFGISCRHLSVKKNKTAVRGEQERNSNRLAAVIAFSTLL